MFNLTYKSIIMKTATIETIEDNKHKLQLDDQGLIQLYDIVKGAEWFGARDIQEHQERLHTMAQDSFEKNPQMVSENFKTVSLINEVFVYLAIVSDNASVLRDKLAPVSNSL
jgi:hypothetical protein